MRQVAPYALWLGHVGDVRDLRAVLSAGVLAVVDLAMNEPTPTLTRELTYCRFPLVDGAGNPPWVVRAAVDTVATLLRSAVPTLIYCSAAMSRSLVIAAAGLAKVSGKSLNECLAIVADTGPHDLSPALLHDVRGLLG